MHHIPNILTIFRILITPLFIYSFFQPGLGWKIFTFVVFIVSTTTDKVDGYLARKYHWESALGKFLDPLADKVLITSAFICLIFKNYIDIWMVAIIVVRDFVVTWLRSYGHKVGKPVATLEIARWKTGVQVVAIYIPLFFMILKSLFTKYNIQSDVLKNIEQWNLIWYVMLLVTLFTLVTGVIYIFKNRHLFSKQ